MTAPKILVLGATGPAGICLLRELLYRNYATIVYARTPSKIPEDLASNPLLEVVEGQMEDLGKLEFAVAKCGFILSLLGPNSSQGRSLPPLLYENYYSSLFNLMRKHGVKRIMAMNSALAKDTHDSFSLIIFLLALLVRFLAPAANKTIQGLTRVFQEAGDLDWTLFRLNGLPGGHDEESWRKDREDGPTYAGYVGRPGYKLSLQRAALAKWLVDCVETGAFEWIHKMPAVSKSSIRNAKLE